MVAGKLGKSSAAGKPSRSLAPSMKQNLAAVLAATLSFTSLTPFQSQAAEGAAAMPQVLPGKGLAQHDFMYAGESKERRAFIVRKGKVVWSYDDPQGKGEILPAAGGRKGRPHGHLGDDDSAWLGQ